MQYLWFPLAILLCLATLPGIIELAFLTLSGVLPRRSPSTTPGPTPNLRLCIVVPAHNEESGITATINSLNACERGGHEVALVVIADNCNDATAERAREAGARVLERHNAELRGKGYALDFAFAVLLPEGHDAFLIVDADSAVAPNFIQASALMFAQGADALQCTYLADNPDASIRARLMFVAWLAFNLLRPRGRDYCGLSVGILGNGFGLARKTLEQVPFDAGSIAEDLEYHLRLVRAGLRVQFCGDTTVWSAVPAQSRAAAGQRARWEGGRFRMIREQAPGLALEVLQGRWRLLEPLLELLLLPLAFHVFLLLCLLAVPTEFGRWLALFGLGWVALHVAAALVIGRASWREVLALFAAPFYIVWKLTLGRHILKSASTDAAWVRTDRTDSHD
jgi:cellulose synthase/poly-beta-1,6-N-acetylglucosamine synthase-like glycosyltransferase